MFLSNKNSMVTDGVGDLYRCADKLARGKIKMGLGFFEMAKDKIGKLTQISLDEKEVSRDHLYWAEMVLDEYMRIKRLV